VINNAYIDKYQHGNKDKNYISPKKETAIAWFECFLVLEQQFAPTKDEIHISSCLTLHDIYLRYINNVSTNYTENSLYSVISKQFKNIKLPKNTRLDKCFKRSSVTKIQYTNFESYKFSDEGPQNNA
jgi:hypothetical protein